MIMIILFVGFIGGLISSIIAGAKQRNALAWFALGAGFPIIGVIAAIVVGPGTRALELEAGLPIVPEPALRPHGDPNIVTCTFCQERVPRARTEMTADGVFCDACAAKR